MREVFADVFDLSRPVLFSCIVPGVVLLFVLEEGNFLPSLATSFLLLGLSISRSSVASSGYFAVFSSFPTWLWVNNLSFGENNNWLLATHFTCFALVSKRVFLNTHQSTV